METRLQLSSDEHRRDNLLRLRLGRLLGCTHTSTPFKLSTRPIDDTTNATHARVGALSVESPWTLHTGGSWQDTHCTPVFRTRRPWVAHSLESNFDMVEEQQQIHEHPLHYATPQREMTKLLDAIAGHCKRCMRQSEVILRNNANSAVERLC